MDKRRGWTLVVTSLSLWIAAYVMLLVLLPLLAGEPESTSETASPATVFTFLGLLLLTGGLFLAGQIVFVVWFALQNRDMNHITGGRFLTVVWVLLLFVPIANLLSLYKFADHIHEAQTTRGVTGIHPVSMFLLLWVAAFFAWPIAQAQMDRLEDDT